ncbi:hypothetical protein CEB3_c48280 [Peptococcaceae bacterium CEB3]|nr:hypothetical protein CEB3_c48280 [Peptococcaceae bacterium CEB3]
MKGRLTSLLLGCLFIIITGCAVRAPASQQTQTPAPQELGKVYSQANDLVKKYGWVLNSKSPSIQYVDLNNQLWTDQFGLGPIWQFNEILSSSVGLPFKSLVGKKVQVWAYPTHRVRSQGSRLADQYLSVIVYGAKIRGAWLSDRGPFDMPGFSLNGKIPQQFKDFGKWLHKSGWIATEKPPLKELVGKKPEDVIRFFFEKGVSGHIDSAVLTITPMQRSVSRDVDPKSYWGAYFKELSGVKVSAVTPIASLPTWGEKNALASGEDIAYVHPRYAERTYNVKLSNGKIIFVTVVKESLGDPWMIGSITKTP